MRPELIYFQGVYFESKIVPPKTLRASAAKGQVRDDDDCFYYFQQ